MTTTKIRRNVTVLAKDNGNAYTYTNHKQAQAKLDEITRQGVKANLFGVWPIFIAIEEGK